MTSAEDLRQLAEQKEREWKEVQELRAQSVEALLLQTQRELSEEKAKFQKLKEDFKYNLRLLGERDAELDGYDSCFTELKKQLALRDCEISELKIKLDELQNAATRQSQATAELQGHYQHRIRERQAEFDKYRSAKDAEVQKEREELESFRRSLERQLRETEEELDLQKMELTAGFEEAMRKREHEFRTQLDTMSSTVLAHELKAKLLAKEAEMLKEAKLSSEQDCEQAEGNQQQLQKLLKQKDWQLQDVTAMKNAKIADMEAKLEQYELSMKRVQEDFNRKHAELDRHAREKEAALVKVQDAGRETERQLQAAARDIQAQLEEVCLKNRQLEWNYQDMQKNKQDAVDRLEEQLSDVKGRWDAHISQMSQDNVARDVELQTLRENETKLKAELMQRKEDIERYKSELSSSAARESALERSKTQVELDWQRRYEDIERTQYQKTEDLIRSLTTARDEALAHVKERDRELAHHQDLARLLSAERNQALVTLKEHGLLMDKNVDISKFEDLPESAADHITQLQQQNDNLRQVIRQMRQEMEMLGDQLPGSAGSGPKTPRNTATEAYIKNLEGEVKSLKARCRQQQQGQLSQDVSLERQGQDRMSDIAGENPLLRAHLEQLNNLLGTLRSEKVDLAAQLRKQQAKLQHLQTSVEQLSKEPREKQVQIEQLQYELGAESRRHQAEAAGLRQQVTDLQLQLTETRKEADEYYKANVERNMEVTSIAQELSQLKMEVAQGRPPLNFGAQELLIQQLQDEISLLQKKCQGQDLGLDPIDHQPIKGQGFTPGADSTVAKLQNKLRLAAKHISQLAREKQQLIEVGNRLRAELNKNGITPPSPPRRSHQPPKLVHGIRQDPVPAGSTALQQQIHSKLGQLEQLQYELTKQELAKAQQQYASHSVHVPAIEVASTSTDSCDTGVEKEWQPQSILKKTGSAGQQKLLPVPEGTIPPSRPRTAPEPKRDNFHPGTVRPTSSGQPLLMSMSSIGGESLDEIWKLLEEEGQTPRPVTPPSGRGLLRSGQLASVVPDPRPASSQALAVQGSSAQLVPKPMPEQRHLSEKASGKLLAGMKTKAKIRNYNVREDDAAG